MFDRTRRFRELIGCESPECEVGGVAISQFIQNVNEICRDIVELKRELDEEDIMELDSIISKRAGSEEEKRCSSLSSKVQACQNKILGMERELDKEEEGNAEIKSRNISKRMIISSIYTLMGELASQAQSRIAHRLETQYVRSQKFKTRESGRLSSECGLARNPSESGGPYCGDLDEGVEDLTPEMERAAQELLNHFTSDLDALRESQRQLHEISSLMSFFSTKIQEQSEICSNILTDANDAVDHLDESTIYIQRLEEIYGKKR